MPPGRAALYCSPSLSDPSFLIELFCADSPFVLYSVEGLDTDAPYLVFLELSPEARRKMWKEEAFIDRGIRKLVELGSHVVVMSLETAEDYAASALDGFACGRVAALVRLEHGPLRLDAARQCRRWAPRASRSRTRSTALQPVAGAGVRRARAARLRLSRRADGAAADRVPGWARPTIFVFNPKAGGMKVAAASVAAIPARAPRVHVPRVPQGRRVLRRPQMRRRRAHGDRVAPPRAQGAAGAAAAARAAAGRALVDSGGHAHRAVDLHHPRVDHRGASRAPAAPPTRWRRRS